MRSFRERTASLKAKKVPARLQYHYPPTGFGRATIRSAFLAHAVQGICLVVSRALNDTIQGGGLDRDAPRSATDTPTKGRRLAWSLTARPERVSSRFRGLVGPVC